MKTPMIKTKILRSIVPIALLAAQQFCFCLLFCSMLHEHRSAEIGSVLRETVQFEAEHFALPADGCGEKQHLKQCEKEPFSRVSDTEGVAPAAEAPAGRFRAVNFPPATDPVKSSPDLKKKIFLHLHVLRC